jgi:hypothetical protein
MAPILLPTMALILASDAAPSAAPALSTEVLMPAIEEYLQQKGHLCLGKFDWPISVSDGDRQSGTKDAVQMPVLEKQGLASASRPGAGAGAGVGAAAVTRYDLSEKGRKYYLVDKTALTDAARAPHPGDLCGATLKLDQIVKWETPEVVDGHPQTTVKYTYRVIDPADWILDGDVNRVFPMVHRLLIGARSLQLEQVFAWTDGHWVAVAPNP